MRWFKDPPLNSDPLGRAPNAARTLKASRTAALSPPVAAAGASTPCFRPLHTRARRGREAWRCTTPRRCARGARALRASAFPVLATSAWQPPSEGVSRSYPRWGRGQPSKSAACRPAGDGCLWVVSSVLLDQPLAHAEFLVVDTETNGLAGEACELTEVGAVLVGGGELHDRFESLIGVRAPLGRGIQRFTGITQAMVDHAPAAEVVLPDVIDQLEGRVLVGHNVSFDRRVLRQACQRAGLAWPNPPSLCTVAMARRFAPLVRQRRLASLAGALGVEVEVQHRALADAETCARVFCALFPRLCAHAVLIRDAVAALRPMR